jgi:lysophospholipid acyltransferase (LPLAT)-like uncharacterized protein
MVHLLKKALAPVAWRMLTATWRCNETPLAPSPADGPVIFACLHGDILPAIRYCRPARPVLLVSKSPDGVILERTLARDGYGMARGSTGHDGHEGFVGLLRALRDGRHVGVAVDGPRGPQGHIHDGALQLARMSGAPILPLTVTGTGCVHLGTWDRTLVPLPWARLDVWEGAPVIVPADADARTLEECRGLLAARLGCARRELVREARA